jgi:malonyl-CoA O-methyltransferase
MSSRESTEPVILSIDAAPTSLWRRLPSALERRARYGWSRFVAGPRPPLAAATVDWLKQADLGPGVPTWMGDGHPSLAATAHCAAALWSFGQRTTVDRWLEWILTQQLSCGAFADRHGRASLNDTAMVLTALTAIDGDEHPTADALAHACEWLASAIADDNHSLLVADLVGLPPLLAAARHLRENAWEDAVWRALARLRRGIDLTRWEAPSPWFAAIADALVDLGEDSLARQAMLLPAALQRRNGSVPALPTAPWISSEGLARFAQVWFKLGDRPRGARALAALNARQSSNGGLPHAWGRGAAHADRHSAAAACQVLNASLTQVRAAFEATSHLFENTIDPADGRVVALRQSLMHLPPGARIADVGCGKGRFLRALMPEFPTYRWTGIDLSPAMLSHLPAGATPRKGNLLRLDEPDEHYDAAFAVESLEHSLLPEQAVRELVRIVKPGGRIVIIDKNQQRQALSLHDPWERWFSPDAVETWLRADCQQIEVRSIRHGANSQPTGLFLCWTARRSGHTAARAA